MPRGLWVASRILPFSASSDFECVRNILHHFDTSLNFLLNPLCSLPQMCRMRYVQQTFAKEADCRSTGTSATSV